MTAAEPDVLQTSVGRAVVRHRLALAVECRDALSDRLTDTGVRARYRRLPSLDPTWRPLGRGGAGCFVLRHAIPDDPDQPLPQLEIAVDDRNRRYVARRFVVTPWTYAEVREPAPYVDPYARLLRLWLRPGSAYPFPRTGTVIRGRIEDAAGQPVRWARVKGTTLTSVAGWAHADDRGEFVLVVVDPGFDPARDSRADFVVTLDVTARRNPPAPDPKEPVTDLVSEPVPRSTNPPADGELDNDGLRGAAVPAGYIPNTTAARLVTVPIGAAVTLTRPIVFTP